MDEHRAVDDMKCRQTGCTERRRAASLNNIDLESLCAATFAHWSNHKYCLMNGVLADMTPPPRTVRAVNDALARLPTPEERCRSCVGPPPRVVRAVISGSVADGLDGTHLFGSRPWPDSDYDYMLQLDGDAVIVEAEEGDGDGDGGDDDDDDDDDGDNDDDDDDDDGVGAGAGDFIYDDSSLPSVTTPDSAISDDSATVSNVPPTHSEEEGVSIGTSLPVYQAIPSRRHPGFFRVVRRRTSGCRHQRPLPLSAGQVRRTLAAAVRLSGPQPVTLHGPAVTRHHHWFSVDLVPCLRAIGGGGGGGGWLSELSARARPAGWPSPGLLCRLTARLQLVPVGPTPTDRRLWRVSFSRPEAELARALPTRARFCLMLLRGLRRRCRTEVPLVSSYQLKTCTFWLCERRPVAAWG